MIPWYPTVDAEHIQTLQQNYVELPHPTQKNEGEGLVGFRPFLPLGASDSEMVWLFRSSKVVYPVFSQTYIYVCIHILQLYNYIYINDMIYVYNYVYIYT